MRKYTPRSGSKMQADAAVTLEMGRRVAAYLRQRYPRDGVKLVAKEFSVSPHTTRRWFEGCMPENRHFAALAKRFGKAFVALVMEPAVGPWPSYAMLEEIEEMELRLAHMRADLEAEDARGRLALARAATARAAARSGVVPEGEEEAAPVAPAAGRDARR